MVSFPLDLPTIFQLPIELFSKVRTIFGLSRNLPLIKRLLTKDQRDYKNKYYMVNHYIDNDPALYGSIKFTALTISQAYKQYGVEVVRDVRDIVFNLVAYGDVFIYKDSILPIFELSVVDKRHHIGKYVDTVIAEENYICINEMSSKRKVFNNKDVFHLSLFPTGHLTKDIYGRWTYNIYGRSPTMSVLLYLTWKEKLIQDDILIKDRMIPREVHYLKLDLPLHAFPGRTIDEKLENQKQYVEMITSDYISNISQMQPGEHYVLCGDVKVDVLEPKINYTTPNDLIHQINEYVVGCFNVPLSAVLGHSKSSYASELAVASYFTTQANAIVQLVNEYLEIKYGRSFEDVHVILDIWKDSLYRRAALLVKLGVLSAEAARKLLNLEGFETPSNKVKVDVDVDGRSIAAIERQKSPIQTNTPLSEDKRDEEDEYRVIEKNFERNTLGER